MQKVTEKHFYKPLNNSNRTNIGNCVFEPNFDEIRIGLRNLKQILTQPITYFKLDSVKSFLVYTYMKIFPGSIILIL